MRKIAGTPDPDFADAGSVASAAARALDAAVSSWRVDLLKGVQSDATVAASMSRAIAELNVATLGFTEQLRATQEATARILAQSLEPLTGIAEMWTKRIAEAIEGANVVMRGNVAAAGPSLGG